MKPTFLSKLHTNGIYYLIGALLLLVAIPLYQLFVLLPQGYGDAVTAEGNGALSYYLLWLADHLGQFLVYRLLLILALAASISFPFTLFRIIVAQEILGQEEIEQHEAVPAETAEQEQSADEDTETTNGMPAYAWRGKGFAVIAAWAGVLSIILYIFGTTASALYLAVVSSTFAPHGAPPANFATITSILNLIPDTIGGGLLALSCLLFGAIIASRGLKLWPRVWILFGYTALAVAALLSGSAVAVASAPEVQSVFTTPATLLFALWLLWFGIMLVRLKPEQ